MAGSAARKAAKREADAKQFYGGIAIGVTLLQIAVAQLIFGGFSLLMAVATTACHVFACASIISSAREDANASMSKDLFYVTIFVQLLSLYTDSAWYVLLIVPAVGIYKGASFLYGMLGMFGGAFGGGGGGDADDGSAAPQFDMSTKDGRRAARIAEKRAQRKQQPVQYR